MENKDNDIPLTNVEWPWDSGTLQENEKFLDALWSSEPHTGRSDGNQEALTPDTTTTTRSASMYRDTPPEPNSDVATTPESLCVSPRSLLMKYTPEDHNITQQQPPQQQLPAPFPILEIASNPVESCSILPPTSPTDDSVMIDLSDIPDTPITKDRPHPEDAQQFLRKKRRRNKLAVARSRQKKNTEIDEMKEREKDLCEENQALKNHERLLRDEVLELKSQVLSHHECHDNEINAYIQGRAQLLSRSF